jgi:S1-C subfamily serine protease
VLNKILFACSIVMLTFVPSEGTLIPPQYMDCVVAIGHMETTASTGPDNQVKLESSWVADSTGFLYGKFVAKLDDTHTSYRTFLVTNRHVIEGHIAAKADTLLVKFNLKSEDQAARTYEVPLTDAQGKPTWHAHPDPNVDLVVIPVDANILESQGAAFDYFHSDRDLLTRARAKEIGLSEGDGVFVMGFPMGLVGAKQDYVIVRQGVVARVRDVLGSTSQPTFLIDAFVFPGNSGGPVVLKPELVSIQGAKPAIQQAYLLGIVDSFLPYIDTAVSQQTKRPRVTFEENSGLTEVIPADFIEETITDLDKK